MRTTRLAAWAVLYLGLAALGGCGGPSWPRAPQVVRGDPAAPRAALWQPEGEGNGRYLQLYRQGVKRSFYIDQDNDGLFELLVDVDELDPAQVRWVFIYLDGVPYRQFRELYDEGHFRLFHPPAKMISTFPSITDIAFSTMYNIPGTSCYESVVYDRVRNDVRDGLEVYLGGRNELWASLVDYRQHRWLDAVGYIMPRFSGRREFGRMFGRAADILAERPEQQVVVIYTMATDAINHTGQWHQARTMLLELERYIEELVYRQRGRLGVLLLSDHGNNFVQRCRRVDVQGAVERAGLNARFNRGFRRPGDVVVLRYGLVSLVEAYCQSEADRQKLLEALVATEGIEHVMWRVGENVRVAGLGGVAEIARRVEPSGRGAEEYFSYRRIQGDPLELQGLLDGLAARRFAGDAQAYYAAEELLLATAGHVWPDPLWRIWHGLSDHPVVVPDVVASMALGWYYGDTTLEQFSEINGTHGGLRDADTNTFFTTNLFAPPAVMRTAEVPAIINRHFPWVPRTVDPGQFGMQEYLTGPVTPAKVHPPVLERRFGAGEQENR